MYLAIFIKSLLIIILNSIILLTIILNIYILFLDFILPKIGIKIS
jgi:hypothetical protein